MKSVLIVTTLITFLLVAGKSQSVEWLTLGELQEKQAEEPRKVIVDLYTQWCGWCKKMDQSTFSDSSISELMSDKYYAVRFDAESKDDIEFMGNHYQYVRKYGRKGYHEFAAALTEGYLSFPTIIFMDESMHVIQAIRGYQGPDRFGQILAYFADDHHKTTPWNQFTNDFKPNIHMVKSKND